MDTTQTRCQTSRGRPRAGTPSGWLAGCACLLMLAGLLVPVPAARAQVVSEEARIKAAMVYNLARSVVWPSGFDSLEQFSIAVAGNDSVASAMTAIAGKHVNGKPVVVTGGPGAGTDRRCQILYVSNTTKDATLKLVGAMARPGVLTVSDVSGFCENGGIVEMRADRGRIRLLINRAAASAAGLRLSSQILKVAELFDSPNPSGGDTAQSLPPR